MAGKLSDLWNLSNYWSGTRGNSAVNDLISNGTIRQVQTTGGGEDAKQETGYTVDWGKLPTIQGTQYRPGQDTGAGVWQPVTDSAAVIDPSRVIDDPNYGPVTTSDNLRYLSGTMDWLGPLLVGGAAGIGALYGGATIGAGVAGAGAGAGTEGALSENILQGLGGGSASGGAITTGGDILTGLQPEVIGGAAAGGAAGSPAGGLPSNVEQATGAAGAAGGGAGSGGSGLLSSLLNGGSIGAGDWAKVISAIGAIGSGIVGNNAVNRATDQTVQGIDNARNYLQDMRGPMGERYAPYQQSGISALGRLQGTRSTLRDQFKPFGSALWKR